MRLPARIPAASIALAPVIAMVLGLAACAPRPAATNASVEAARPADVAYGRIASVRPMAPREAARAGDPRSSILNALGGGAVAASFASGGPHVEFVIRADGGQTLSVVQANAESFQPGERVVLTGGARTRIARMQ